MTIDHVRRFRGLSVSLILLGGFLFIGTHIGVYGTELGDNPTESCMDRPVPAGVPLEGGMDAFHTEWPLGSTCVYGDVVVPEPDWAPTYYAIGSGFVIAAGLGVGIFGALRRDY